jgi:ABC-type bacteriocin/lantibiotic exporter with double-glycine peptidase domain
VGRILDGFPLWSQNADPGAGGIVDAYYTADCGEECCSIVQRALGAGYTTEGDIRRAMPGHKDHGETTGPDLVAYLQSAHIHATYKEGTPPAARAGIPLEIRRGSPCIALGYWLSSRILHWVVVIGYGNDHCFYIDPWDGQLKAVRWNRFMALSAGGYVVASRQNSSG